MGGFLGALGMLAPIGQTLGGEMQLGEFEQQKQNSRNAFGKALDALGPDPEFDIARQMFKSGASVHDITGMMSGPIGQELMTRHQSLEAQRIFSDPSLTQEQAFTQWGALTGDWKPYLTMEEYKYKPHAASLDDKLAAVQASIETNKNLSPSDRAIGERAVATGNQALADEFLNKIEPKYAGTGKSDELTPEQETAIQHDPAYQKFHTEHPSIDLLKPADRVKAFLNWTKPSPAETGMMEQQQIAMGGLDDMLSAGEAVLPSVPPGGSWSAMAQTQWRKVLEAKGDPAVGAYRQAQTAIIPHLRALASTGRVNGPELEMASNALQNAASKEQLQVAVALAKRALQRAYQIVREKGLVEHISGEPGKSGYGVTLDPGDTGGGGRGIEWTPESEGGGGGTEYPNPGEYEGGGPSDDDYINMSR